MQCLNVTASGTYSYHLTLNSWGKKSWRSPILKILYIWIMQQRFEKNYQKSNLWTAIKTKYSSTVPTTKWQCTYFCFLRRQCDRNFHITHILKRNLLHISHIKSNKWLGIDCMADSTIPDKSSDFSLQHSQTNCEVCPASYSTDARALFYMGEAVKAKC